MPNIDDFFLIADNAGIRLEIIDGLPVWEALPNLTHQEAIDRIRQTFSVSSSSNGDCACLHYADLHIKFPDGSDKRPDISIFCQRPSETESAVTEVPEAVIEIISKGYEKKDLELGPPFYLGQGVKDVVVYNPYNGAIRHFDSSRERNHKSPTTLILHCGCQVTL
ncbi:MAG: Uma2 family endonuclease [Blastocatellia bacterium]